MRFDHEPLRWLLRIGEKDSDGHGRLARWRLKTAEHNNPTVYKCGATHLLGDALSSQDTRSWDPRRVEEDIPVIPLCSTCSAAHGVVDNTLESSSAPLYLLNFREAQDNDENCRRHRRNLLSGTAGPFSKSSDGLIYRRARADGQEKIVGPVSLRSAVMQRKHDNQTAGHPGKSCMFAAMRSFFYRPAMAVDIADHVRECHPCARSRLSLHRRATPIELFQPDGPNELVAIDLLGPLPITIEGNKDSLVISNRFTKLSRRVALLICRSPRKQKHLAILSRTSLLTVRKPQLLSKRFEK